MDEQWQITLDHPVRPVPRYGYGKPPHTALHALIDAGRTAYRERLLGVLRYADGLLRIPLEGGSPGEAYWTCGWLRCLDAATLYALIADLRPQTYLEVGSGCSTLFARRALADHSLRTRIVSIDPSPRDAIDALCDEVVREPLEDLDPGRFAELVPGDVVFVDGSHRLLPNSDVTAFFLDVLPSLADGVYVGIHDIFLPRDYPPRWSRRFYSEQYVLGAYLLARPPCEIVLANAFVSEDPELGGILVPLWDQLGIDTRERWGSSFWLRLDADLPERGMGQPCRGRAP